MIRQKVDVGVVDLIIGKYMTKKYTTKYRTKRWTMNTSAFILMSAHTNSHKSFKEIKYHIGTLAFI